MNTTSFFWLLSARARRTGSSAIRDLLKLTERPGIISFAGGLPSAQAFPTQAIADAAVRVLAEDGTRALQYSPTEGYGPLREHIAQHLEWTVTADQVLITSGSQQGLDLLARVLLDADDRILVESPTYLGALQAFAPYEAQVQAVACDGEGMLPQALREAMAQGATAKFLYLQPNFQNPTGRIMSFDRRREIVAIAVAAGVPVIEDDPYGKLWFRAAPPPPLSSLNPQGSVYLGSFSKVLAPGLRLGYLVAPPPLLEKLVHAKQAADLQSATFNQHIASQLFEDGLITRHVPAIRDLYRRQRDAMLAALKREFGDQKATRWNTPEGGMFLWLTLPPGLDASVLLPQAIARGVAFVPGAPFFHGHGDPRCLRLSFVTAGIEDIDRGIGILATVVRDAM